MMRGRVLLTFTLYLRTVRLKAILQILLENSEIQIAPIYPFFPRIAIAARAGQKPKVGSRNSVQVTLVNGRN